MDGTGRWRQSIRTNKEQRSNWLCAKGLKEGLAVCQWKKKHTEERLQHGLLIVDAEESKSKRTIEVSRASLVKVLKNGSALCRFVGHPNE